MNYSERREKELLNEPGLAIVPAGPGWGAFLLSLVLTGLVAWFYVWSAGAQGGEESRGRGAGIRGGQGWTMAHVLHARLAHAPEEGAGLTENFLRQLPQVTDGEVQPLWPWVMGHLAEEGHGAPGMEPVKDAGLLGRARGFQVGMLAGFLVLCGAMAGRVLSPGAVLPALLPGVLAVLLPYGAGFTPAGMSYVLVFLSWVCALRLLFRNSVWLHALFGVLTGLAWLTEVTALLVVAAWLAAATARWVFVSLRRGEQGVDETWIARNHFVGLLAVVLAWAAVCGPRCGAAMDHWGRPLFSWQQYWMWLDGPAEAVKLADGYEEVRGLENGRRVDLPGWGDYWKTHTREQAGARLAAGSALVWGAFLGGPEFSSPGKGEFVAPAGLRQRWWLGGGGALLLLAWLAVVTRRRGAAGFPHGAGSAVLFVVLTCGGYGLWYAWYAPIQCDARFLMVLYLPLMWSLLWAAERLMSLARMRGLTRSGWLAWQGLLWLFSAALVADVMLLMQGTDVVAWLR